MIILILLGIGLTFITLLCLNIKPEDIAAVLFVVLIGVPIYILFVLPCTIFTYPFVKIETARMKREYFKL